jgi:hypothetical protein
MKAPAILVRQAGQARLSLRQGRWSARQTLVAILIAVLSLLGVAVTAYLFEVGTTTGSAGFDALCYWAFDMANPYGGKYGGVNFAYAPPIALAFLPGHLLSFEQFHALWVASQFALLMWLGRRYTLALLLFVPVAVELYNGNIHLLLAAAIVVGFRYPAAWSLVLMTKITPGIGLLWFAVRREWRSLEVALGATLAIAAASMVVVPGWWVHWFEFLATDPSVDTPFLSFGPPLPLRLAAAVFVVVYGARTDRRWMVPVAATIALPVLWYNGFAMAVAVLPLWHDDMARLRLQSRPRASADGGGAVPTQTDIFVHPA